jgi:3-isopropylmalate/(R)-2-methylmalate dehydratase small subunit
MKIEGRAWVFGDDISTDLLYPQVAYSMDPEEAPTAVFRANRPGWSSTVEAGDLIIAGRNFGMGSSRPAAMLLRRLGIGAVVTESMTTLFFRNCINSGLPPLVCPDVRSIVREGQRIRLDLATGSVENLETGESLAGKAMPEFLVETVAKGGIIPSLRAQGFLPEA